VTAVDDFAVERLARPAASRRCDVAVVDGERSVTYAELDRAADQVANGLAGMGLGAGGRVAYVGRSCLEGVEALLGAARAGTVLTIVNWRLHPIELSYVIGDCEPGLIVTTDEFAETLAEVPEAAGIPVLVVGGTGPHRWEAWRASQSAEPPDTSGYADDDVVLQLYTSGTTGRPKGAMLTRRSLAACIPDTMAVWELDPSSVVYAKFVSAGSAKELVIRF